MKADKSMDPLTMIALGHGSEEPGEGKPGEAPPEEDKDAPLMDAMSDLHMANKAGDTAGMAMAFRAAFMHMESQPHDEAEEPEEQPEEPVE